MAVPKFRISKSRRDMRRSHHALKVPGMSICEKSGDVKRPHMVGPTGYYKGRLIDPKRAKKSAPYEFNENSLT